MLKLISSAIFVIFFFSEAAAECLTKNQARAKWPQAHLYWHTMARSRCWDDKPKLTLTNTEKEPQAVISIEPVELVNTSWYPLPFSDSEPVLLLQAADFYPMIPPSAESAREAIYAADEYNPLDAAANAPAALPELSDAAQAEPNGFDELMWAALLGISLTFFGVGLPSTLKAVSGLRRLFMRRNQKSRQAGGLSAILRAAER